LRNLLGRSRHPHPARFKIRQIRWRARDHVSAHHVTKHEPRLSDQKLILVASLHSPLITLMFKGILPPRRVPSTEFIIVSPLVENGKENLPSPSPAHPEAASPNGKATPATKSAKAAAQDKSKRRKGDVSHAAPTSNSTDREFDRLLVRTRDQAHSAATFTHNVSICLKQDDLQIPSTLRPKLAGMEPAVKAAMLKSSHVLGPAATASVPAPAARGLRRVQSGSSINIEFPLKGSAAVLDHHAAKKATPPDAQGGPSGATATTAAYSHSRGVSVDVVSPQRPKSRSGFVAGADSTGNTARGKVLSPLQFVSLLTGKSSLELEVDVVKKLRLLLRNEAAR
jgi:hypothetical protein